MGAHEGPGSSEGLGPGGANRDLQQGHYIRTTLLMARVLSVLVGSGLGSFVGHPFVERTEVAYVEDVDVGVGTGLLSRPFLLLSW